MKCDKCGYSDNGSGDWAHACGPVAIQRAPVMNSRIQELALQAGWDYSKIERRNQTENFDEQKFAELIVKECVDIVEQDMKLAHIQMIPLTLEKYANGRLKEKIREHFGVEE